MPTVTVTQATLPIEVKNPLKELTAPLDNLLQIAKDFSKIYHDLALSSSTQFLPTPITSLPDGKENGKFLALDLGGSNLRVGVVELCGVGAFKEPTPATNDSGSPWSGSVSPSSTTQLVMEPNLGLVKSEVLTVPRFRIAPSSAWGIPDYLKSMQAEALFDWVGECIASVIRTYLSQCSKDVAEEIIHEGLALGVTFSFPMVQSSHTSALLMPMGKGFTFSTTNDLATLLTNAYAKVRILSEGGVKLPKVEVVAITNDSISTLLAGGYVHKGNAAVGIIVGTGTNATCLCPVGKLADFKKPTQKADATHVLLNTEWSINGTLPAVERHMTKWDRILDKENEKPGFQPLEEMVSGRYLGEIVRLASLDVLGKEGAMLPSRFYKPYAVETKLCAEVEGEGRVEKVIEILKSYFCDKVASWNWDTTSATTFTSICKTVSNRAAALVVAATVGILDVNNDLGLYSPKTIQQEEEIGGDVIISFTGTVLEKYPNFRERCQRYIEEITEKLYDEQAMKSTHRRKVRLVEAKNGGIIGAAVLAAMVKAART
ncbi:hypothetical protein EV426DRAFT_603188 [Tirmania nivea]|nr:hypothetical protein EV426DRAFT_603188 [Tirmania nivea]